MNKKYKDSIKKRLKWKFIMLLDNDDYCWANLVMWYFGFKNFWSLFFKNHPENDYKIQICRPENELTPYGYCGKCQKYFEEAI